jgi:hypothetical protein
MMKMRLALLTMAQEAKSRTKIKGKERKSINNLSAAGGRGRASEEVDHL